MYNIRNMLIASFSLKWPKITIQKVGDAGISRLKSLYKCRICNYSKTLI